MSSGKEVGRGNKNIEEASDGDQLQLFPGFSSFAKEKGKQWYSTKY